MTRDYVFQVQRARVGEKNYGDGPWRTVVRRESLAAAEAYIRDNPEDWTKSQVYCDPRDVEVALRVREG